MTGHVVSSHENLINFKDFTKMSANVAMASNFGFELDMSKMTKDEILFSKEYIDNYKEIRETIQFGRFHRLESPFDGPNVSWQFTAQDNTECVAFFYQFKSSANGERRVVKLVDLLPDAIYECNGKYYYGEELMNVGITVPLSACEWDSIVMRFEKLK